MNSQWRWGYGVWFFGGSGWMFRAQQIMFSCGKHYEFFCNWYKNSKRIVDNRKGECPLYRILFLYSNNVKQLHRHSIISHHINITTKYDHRTPFSNENLLSMHSYWTQKRWRWWMNLNQTLQVRFTNCRHEISFTQASFFQSNTIHRRDQYFSSPYLFPESNPIQ